jgi:O-antigen ligase/tetratricopeptide (TPR) repeat protein
MTKQPTKSDISKNKALVYLEYILFAVCLCVITLRTTFNEGLSAQSANQPINLSSSVYSLSISAVLIFSLVLWFLCSLLSSRFSYRFAGIEIGLVLFCVSAAVSGFWAPDKRMAINDFTILIAPILMVLLLVQILNSPSKIKLVLVFVAALGIVSAYRCWEQHSDNERLIEFYEQDPAAALAQQHIAPNSLKHFQFEHRLYSKDISGFFTTSNSAGSFALLASFTVIALFIDRYKNRSSDPLRFAWLITSGIAVAVVISGLVITASKGAIGAALAAAAMFAAYLCFGSRLSKHRKTILVFCLLLGLVGSCAIAWYGLTYDRLPGGKSMLVRWQYWHAAARMYADHPFAGVGPGNFSNFYPHYKPAAALETVADPHNFVLTILTQYGPVGLIAFLAMIFLPLWIVSSPSSAICPPELRQPQPSFKKLAIVLAIIASAVLLFIRPIVFPMPPAVSLQEKMAGILILYIMPVVVFIAGFLLVAAGERPAKSSGASIAIAALFCAVAGVALHNLVDFAIFEPGVSTVFWALIACLAALDYQQKSRRQFVLKPTVFVGILSLAAAALIIWTCLNYALVPVAKSIGKIRQAEDAASIGEFEMAHNLLAAAAKDDPLSPTPSLLNGRLYLQRFLESQPGQIDLLKKSEKNLHEAIKRNKVDSESFEHLGDVYNQWAEVSTPDRNRLLTDALGNFGHAVVLYPGDARLRIKLAEIAEKSGKTSFALQQYKKAVEIEDAYRQQFRIMYPDRKVFSRLGEEKYKNAKQRVKLLSGQSTP